MKDFEKPSGRIPESDAHDVARFLNRLLGLPPDIQNRYYSLIFLLNKQYTRSGKEIAVT